MGVEVWELAGSLLGVLEGCVEGWTFLMTRETTEGSAC